MLAGFYRGMRMGEIIDGERLSDRYSGFFETPKENFIQGAQKAKKFLEPHKNVLSSPGGEKVFEKMLISESYKKFLKQNELNYLSGVGIDTLLTYSDMDQLYSFVQNESAKNDAKKIADKNFSGSTIMGYKMRFPKRPNVTTSLYSYAKIGGTYMKPGQENRCGEKGWTTDRCDRAMKVIESWEVDFDWTRSQHSIGAQFAIDKCRTLKHGETLETLAIKALNGRKSQNPVIKGVN
jgi:hypothetical protein